MLACEAELTLRAFPLAGFAGNGYSGGAGVLRGREIGGVCTVAFFLAREREREEWPRSVLGFFVLPGYRWPSGG